MRKNKIFQASFLFILAFIIFSFLMFALLIACGMILPKSRNILQIIPQSEKAVPEQINWNEFQKLGGYGLIVDEQGHILQSFNKKMSGQIQLFEVLAANNYFDSEQSLFAYDCAGQTKLLIFIPSSHVTLTPTLQMKAGMTAEDYPMTLIMIAIGALYFLGVYFLMMQLSKFLKADQERRFQAEMAEQDRLFKGLAHDMKTPLSAIIGYNQAMKEGLVPSNLLDSYYGKITKNAYLLRDRLNGLLSFTQLGNAQLYHFNLADLLEEVRRYVGENYSYYQANEATIDVLFGEKESFMTPFDKELFDRLLQNILQNSIDHNQPPVTITIHFEDQTLLIKDSGPGIPKDLWERIFEPMVTGDESRTGEQNRGLGLANVRRICQLHHWKVGYDERGFHIGFDDAKKQSHLHPHKKQSRLYPQRKEQKS